MISTMLFRGRTAWKIRLLVLLALVVAAFVYSRRFHPEAEDVGGQRALLAHRQVAERPWKPDALQLLGDVKALSDPAMQGRAVGTPGGARARAYLVGRFRAIGLAPVFAGRYEQPFRFTPSRGVRFWRKTFWQARAPIDGVNLVGRIEGTRTPGACIVVSAHYDHLGIRDGRVYPGADDNASGVAALLAVATWFRTHPPVHCLLFAAFDGEEKGLRGAKAFVAEPPVPLASIVADVNFDMLSHNDANELFAAGLYANPRFRPALDRLRATAVPTILYGHDHPRPFWDSDDWTQGSDHGAFAEHHVPWLYFGVEDHPDYHRPTDTYARINQKFFIGVADAMIDVVSAVDAATDAHLAGRGP